MLAEEGKPYRPDGTVALLADDDFRDALVLRVRVVHLVAIDEEDDVSVLFDRAELWLTMPSASQKTDPARSSQRLLLPVLAHVDDTIPEKVCVGGGELNA